MSAERLQKVLANAGVASRRDCEELIASGRVTVNGRVMQEQGARVDPASDVIAVDGKQLGAPAERSYVMLHKPVGVVSTADDPQGRPTVVELVESSARLFPVGRLDTDSEGLLLLTDDGELTHRLTHPSFEIEKEYRALLNDAPSADALRQWREGMLLEGERTAPAWVEVLEPSDGGVWVRVVLREGRKRQIREVAKHLGYEVLRLIRVREDELLLADLPVGQWRALTAEEVRKLQAHTAIIAPDRPNRSPRRARAEDGTEQPNDQPQRGERAERGYSARREQAGERDTGGEREQVNERGGERDPGPERGNQNYGRRDEGGDRGNERGSRDYGQRSGRDYSARGPFREDRGGARDDRGNRGPSNDRGPRDYGRRDERGPSNSGGGSERGPRDYGQRSGRDYSARGPFREDRGGARDDRGNRGPSNDRGPRDYGRRDERGPSNSGGGSERGPRDYGQRSGRDYSARGPFREDRGGARDDRGNRGPSNDRGPRDYGRRDERGPSNSGGGSERGPRDYGQRSGRDYSARGPFREDRGGARDDRGNRGPSNDRGPRDYGRRDERGPSNSGGGSERGPRDYGQRSGRDYSARGPFREDRGGARDDRGNRGPSNDRRPYRDDRGPRDNRGPSNDRGNRGPSNDRGPGSGPYRDNRGARDNRGPGDNSDNQGNRGPSNDRGPRDYGRRDERGPSNDRGNREQRETRAPDVQRNRSDDAPAFERPERTTPPARTEQNRGESGDRTRGPRIARGSFRPPVAGRPAFRTRNRPATNDERETEE